MPQVDQQLRSYWLLCSSKIPAYASGTLTKLPQSMAQHSARTSQLAVQVLLKQAKYKPKITSLRAALSAVDCKSPASSLVWYGNVYYMTQLHPAKGGAER